MSRSRGLASAVIALPTCLISLLFSRSSTRQGKLLIALGTAGSLLCEADSFANAEHAAINSKDVNSLLLTTRVSSCLRLDNGGIEGICGTGRGKLNVTSERQGETHASAHDQTDATLFLFKMRATRLVSPTTWRTSTNSFLLALSAFNRGRCCTPDSDVSELSATDSQSCNTENNVSMCDNAPPITTADQVAELGQFLNFGELVTAHIQPKQRGASSAKLPTD